MIHKTLEVGTETKGDLFVNLVTYRGIELDIQEVAGCLDHRIADRTLARTATLEKGILVGADCRLGNLVAYKGQVTFYIHLTADLLAGIDTSHITSIQRAIVH